MNAPVVTRTVIVPYQPRWQGSLRTLLESAGLPWSDIRERDLPRFRIALDADGSLAGAAGLEARTGDGLLRSVVVRSDRRGEGLGPQLVAGIEAAATELGLESLFLITDGAAPFFAALGYLPWPRSGAPAAIRAAPQFRSLCPASAALMRKELAPAA